MKIVRREIPNMESAYLAGQHPVLRRVFAGRQVTGENELNLSLSQLPGFDRLHGITTAVRILAAAIEAQQSILILADYDADGATGCAVLVRGLRLFGAQRVSYLVPDRQRYGYGLTPEIAAVAIKRKPDVLVTVDNGISSLEGVYMARTAGIQVVVTDHHLPGVALPQANAIVNPNQPNDEFPSKAIAGVGVAFYLMIALRAHLRDHDWFKRQQLADPNIATLLDLVALGTVADMVPLDYTNRILVEQGLRRIRSGQCCAGINAIIRVAKRSSQQLLSRDLGFAIGPRLNAAGRMESMHRGIECLLCDDPETAADIAAELNSLNTDRQAIEGEMQSSIERWLRGIEHTDTDRRQASACIYREDWHLGVIGILASRIKDRISRPVITFAKDEQGRLKGSARSVHGLNIRDAIDAVDREHPGLIERFGGHAMAAGLTLKTDDLECFAEAFDRIVDTRLAAEDREGCILSDGSLAVRDQNLAMAQRLQAAAPWGQNFPEPIFDDRFKIVARRIVGEKHLKLRLQAAPSAQPLAAMVFGGAHRNDLIRANRLRAAYRLQINHYRGDSTIELYIEHTEINQR